MEVIYDHRCATSTDANLRQHFSSYNDIIRNKSQLYIHVQRARSVRAAGSHCEGELPHGQAIQSIALYALYSLGYKTLLVIHVTLLPLFFYCSFCYAYVTFCNANKCAYIHCAPIVCCI